MKEITAKETVIAAVTSCFATLLGAYLTGSNTFSLQHHNAFKNILFSNITFMGDSIFAFAVAGILIFLFNKKDAGMRLLLATLMTLAITQVIKNIFSGGLPVQLFFEKNAYYFDDALSIPANMISSHTAIAFTLAAFFASASKNKITGIFLFATAIIVAYSRTYTAGENIATLALGIVPAVVAAFATERIMRAEQKVARPKNRMHRKSTLESLSRY
jgi:membrane-associated phospholipid phosphatase